MNPSQQINKLLVITAFFLNLSCERVDECRKIDFVKFSEDDQPMISILKKDSSSCGYQIDFNYCPRKELYINTGGNIFNREDCFWFVLDKPHTEEFCLFNFNAIVGQKNEVEIKYSENRFEIVNLVKETRLEKILDVSGDNVFVFRVFEMYCYEDDYLDVVYFISRNKGILGSYLSYLAENQEHYILPKGSIFEGYIDYSKMKKGSLQ